MKAHQELGVQAVITLNKFITVLDIQLRKISQKKDFLKKNKTYTKLLKTQQHYPVTIFKILQYEHFTVNIAVPHKHTQGLVPLAPLPREIELGHSVERLPFADKDGGGWAGVDREDETVLLPEEGDQFDRVPVLVEPQFDILDYVPQDYTGPSVVCKQSLFWVEIEAVAAPK